MSGADLFCSSCGTPAERARSQATPAAAASSGSLCTSCGTPLGKGDLFCMACGAKVTQAPCNDVGVGLDDPRENAGIGESELIEAGGDVGMTVTSGSEDVPKGGK